MDKAEVNHGGLRVGAGRKKAVTPKVVVALTLDNDLIKWVDLLAGGKRKRSGEVNKILRNHKNHIEQMILEADEVNERF